nr:hypothetical protein [Tanacetum cinerariifolium]
MKDLHVYMDLPKLVAQTEGKHAPTMKQERKYTKEIMNAIAPFHRLQITYLPKILISKAEVLTGLATINLEFLNQEVSMGIKTRQSVEKASDSKKGKAASNVTGAKPNYNWEETPSLAFVKENIDALRTMFKEHDPQAKAKATSKKLAYDESEVGDSGEQTNGSSERFLLESFEASGAHRKEKVRKGRTKRRGRKPEYQEIISDFEIEEDSGYSFEDLNAPYKRPKSTPFTARIACFGYHRRAKLQRNITIYDGNKDPKDYLSIFSAAAEQEEWSMSVWCKMFRQTLGGAAQNWFDDLDPKIANNFEELSQNFLEDYSQQKRYAKDPTKIHGIKRRSNEGLQAFID